MTLYILGNGFDLHNGLKTKYSDFRDWLKEKHSNQYEKIKNLFEPNEFWSNFEDQIANSFSKIENIIEEERQKTTDKGRIFKAVQELTMSSSDLSKLFKKWLKDVLKKNTLEIISDQWIVNFNYTNYIKGTRIMHIHENINFPMGIGIGHSATNKLEAFWKRRTKKDFENVNLPDKANIYNQLSKFPRANKERLKSYAFNKNINKIVFFGFSFGKQDENYFDIFNQDIPVIFHVHDEKEKDYIYSRIKKYFKNVTYVSNFDIVEALKENI